MSLAVVAGPFEIDLAQANRERDLVRGQSFSVTQHFTEASTHPEVVAVRVAIFDGETSASGEGAANLFEMVAAGSTIKRADSLVDERLATTRVTTCNGHGPAT